MAVRVVAAARDAELWARPAGLAGGRRGARRAGAAAGYDPAVVDVLLADGERWLAEIGDDPCAAVLAAEPAPVLTIDDDEARRGARARWRTSST